MLLNCGVGEDSWESLGLQGDPTKSILKKISPGCSLEGLMLKLKLQSFGCLMQRTDSLEKTLMLGKIEGRRRKDNRGWDGWMVSLTQWTWVWINSGRQWRTGKPGVLQSMGSQRVRHDWGTELISHGNYAPIWPRCACSTVLLPCSSLSTLVKFNLLSFESPSNRADW